MTVRATPHIGVYSDHNNKLHPAGLPDCLPNIHSALVPAVAAMMEDLASD